MTGLVLKFEQCVVFNKAMCWKDADKMANHVDPDQTADLGLHCMHYAQIDLSQN